MENSSLNNLSPEEFLIWLNGQHKSHIDNFDELINLHSGKIAPRPGLTKFRKTILVIGILLEKYGSYDNILRYIVESNA